MKPISQIFELVVTLLPGFMHARDKAYFINLENFYYNKFDGDLKKVAAKISKIKKKFVEDIIFQPLIDYANNKNSKVNVLDSWLTTTAKPAATQEDGTSSTSKHVDISKAIQAPQEKAKATIKRNTQTKLDGFFKK